MSMHFGPASSDPAASGLPRGEVLATYDSYAEARKVVDRLAEQDFDVRTVSIVGVDLRTVERIRNRLTYATVALRSALQGAFFGLMLGILMSLIDPSGAGVQILYTVGLGIGIWMLFGVIGHAIRRGKGFDSVQQLVPTRFDVVCDFSAAGRARQILGTAPSGAGAPASPAAPPAPTGPDTPATPGTPAGPAASAQAGRGDAPDTSVPTGAPPAAATPPAAGAEPAPGSAPSPAAEPGPVPDGGPGTAAASRRRRSHLFPDLPDGRPQYGIRLPEAEAQALRERVLGEQAQPAGAAPSAFAAPDYSARGRGRRRDPERPVDGGEATPGERPAPETGEARFARPRYGRHVAPAGTDDGDGTAPQDGADAGHGPETGAGPGAPGRDARD